MYQEWYILKNNSIVHSKYFIKIINLKFIKKLESIII